MKDYEIVIGLEIHVELSTDTKMFCSCTAKFGGEMNTHCCPVCTAMPGTLPVMNKKAVEYAVKAGLSLNCEISEFSKMDRKNYFYPDLPKAYQISQYDLPICQKGYVDIGSKKIRILRIHMEEDAGKLIHDGYGSGTLIDYNRCGVPLIEIVSEPDISTSEEARIYVEKIRSILKFIGVSDCKMQEGSLRVDVNLSVRPKGQMELGTRTEMKNLNSFKSIVRAIESESKRQIKLLESGEKIIQETRRWDDDKGMSYSMRSKEDAHDYRYFPDPDLLPVQMSKEDIERIRKSLPKLPDQRKIMYMTDMSIPEYDADILTSEVEISDLFEEAVNNGADPKKASNWIMGDLMRLLNEREIQDIPIKGKKLAELIALIDKGVISQNIGKKVFSIMFDTLKDPLDIIREEGLEKVDDQSVLEDITDKVIAQNEQSVKDYLAGKDKAIGFLMGQIMKETKGKADPKTVTLILKEKLKSLDK